ncbi:DNA-binding protein YbiB [Curvibacter sp. APW13]|uniref:DNA-binding protein YbiB n=1 Tax=Curvibacter sp. APW13 TaxID=3077236 RepID=UPI0028DF85E5|nr:DNA-binding protein YbiB [Curvibacter sp. APW13]MDT8991158.1 DNA-binding protein YbiB [Curvibacter sp. APW13]
MTIGHYIKDIGRGKEGARDITREQASDLMGQILDGQVSDLELGAFCIAMRIKGESVQEMLGFLDAIRQRMATFRAQAVAPVVVLPSYNGARKLPLLTPLLALLVARQGLPVLIHGANTESARVSTQNVLSALEITARPATDSIANGEVRFVPTSAIHPQLQHLLEVRNTLGLRNSAHSLVKLLAPCTGAHVLVTSYTHPEYADSMAATLQALGSTALLLRGTEGEAVADARRCPRMQGIHLGSCEELQARQEGSLAQLPELPADITPESTARYTRAVLAGELPIPEPVACQLRHIVALAAR